MSDRCIFCRIVEGTIPAAIVAQNEYAVAFRDLHPQAPLHVLVIPRRHVASLNEATDPALKDDFRARALAAGAAVGVLAAVSLGNCSSVSMIIG